MNRHRKLEIYASIITLLLLVSIIVNIDFICGMPFRSTPAPTYIVQVQVLENDSTVQVSGAVRQTIRK